VAKIGRFGQMARNLECLGHNSLMRACCVTNVTFQSYLILYNEVNQRVLGISAFEKYNNSKTKHRSVRNEVVELDIPVVTSESVRRKIWVADAVLNTIRSDR
jgi:hypothetical protein